MSNLQDKTGAEVTVQPTSDGRAFGIEVVADGVTAGRAFFLDHDGERIFYHTEVDEAYGGRGLATILVREALEASRKDDLVIVPVCPLVKGFLDKNGDDFTAQGGEFRRATRDDVAFVQNSN